MTFVAVGEVTKAIVKLLTSKLNKPPLLDLDGDAKVRVTSVPPDDERVDDDNGVNLFLYRVAESPFMKNVDWRGDQLNPQVVKRPPLALTLHYLLTAYAKKSDSTALEDITAHKILGNAMAIIHNYPILNDIHDGDFDANIDDHLASELRHSFEKIKIALSSTPMEEIVKLIWTGPTSAYRLSVPYEVSLLQIAPMVPVKPPEPPVQKLDLEVRTIDGPKVASIEPSTGPVGTQVTIKGSGFKAKGLPTSVTIGETIMTENDLERFSSEEIILKIPEAPQRGPRIPVMVSAGAQESTPVYYEVQPWVKTIQPLRGITGIPITIPFHIPTGANVKVEIDGKEADVTTDPQNNMIKATVPTSIDTNGPKTVVLILDGAQPKRSNARIFEVLPHVKSVDIATDGDPTKTTIKVTGERLAGKEVHVKYGQLLLRKGENTTATQVEVEVKRVLASDQPVSVLVDNRESNTLPPHLETIEPKQASVGESVKLIGKSLSGRNVIVHFGTVTETIGAYAYSSQLEVKIPLTVTPGEVPVKVVVDNNESNTIKLEVTS